jgi:hypothetical protein
MLGAVGVHIDYELMAVLPWPEDVCPGGANTLVAVGLADGVTVHVDHVDCSPSFSVSVWLAAASKM